MADPVFQGIQGIIDIGGSHQGADGGATDHIGLDARRVQLTQNTDMRPAPGGAATQSQSESFRR